MGFIQGADKRLSFRPHSRTILDPVNPMRYTINVGEVKWPPGSTPASRNAVMLELWYRLVVLLLLLRIAESVGATGSEPTHRCQCSPSVNANTAIKEG